MSAKVGRATSRGLSDIANGLTTLEARVWGNIILDMVEDTDLVALARSYEGAPVRGSIRRGPFRAESDSISGVVDGRCFVRRS